jgi:hypothetical protein
MPAKPRHTMALFGEAEKGQYKKPYVLRDLAQLVDAFGNPPPDSQGLFFAVQALLYQRELIFFRVEEEGFSIPDYYYGLKYLEDPEKVDQLNALCLPGIGDPQIMKASCALCEKRKSFLITTQKDLYDYLTA